MGFVSDDDGRARKPRPAGAHPSHAHGRHGATGEESPEVARVREQLAALGARIGRPGEQPREEARVSGTAVPQANGTAAREIRKGPRELETEQRVRKAWDQARARATAASPEPAPPSSNASEPRVYEAWSELPERPSEGLSQPGRPELARVRWEGPTGSTGELRVARVVAKAFGSDRRPYDTQPDIMGRVRAIEHEKAWERLQSLVKARERCGADLESRLTSEGFPRPCAHEAVERARRCLLVDDARFAGSFVRSKARAGWGRERVARELRRLGVDDADMEPALDETLPRDDELARARELLARRRVPDTNPVPKLARFLVGRGFNSSVAFSVARERAGEGGDGD